MAGLESALIESQGFDSLVGLQISEITTDRAAARVELREELLQPFAMIHGGVYAAIAESLATRGTFAGVWEDGSVALGLSNNTSFLRPISSGTVNAVAQPVHRGRTTWVWDVVMSDDDGNTCAVSRVTIAVRPRREFQAR
jgi:uncharacterized protein (TIGR00369 family)